MVFKRRNRRSPLQVLTEGVYPRGGWTRAASYVMHRLRRLPDPPHKIARGIAAGVFVSFTPLFGFHFVFAALMAAAIQGNILAALLATFIGNPVTFPVIATLCMETGFWLLGTEGGVALPKLVAEFSRATLELWHNLRALFTEDVTRWHRMSDFFWGTFMPYLVGGLPYALISSIIAYRLTVPAVEVYQKRRVKKMQARFEKRRAAEERRIAETAARSDGAPPPGEHFEG